MCYGAERATEAALELVNSARVELRDIRRVIVTTGRNQIRMLRFAAPATAGEARFSFPFAMAAALLRRDLGIAEISDEFVLSSAVRELMAKVVVEAHDEVDTDDLRFGAYDEVAIETLDGRVHRSRRIHHARGHHLNPLRLDERWRKFEACARTGGMERDARTLFDRLDHAEDQPSGGMALWRS
jgi:2-methylcitrate dehydratase PrpD